MSSSVHSPRAAPRRHHRWCRGLPMVGAVAVVLLLCVATVRGGCIGDGDCNCSGHGHCYREGLQFNCECFPGWEGAACQRATCPTGLAWTGDADTSGNSHFEAVCSNAVRAAPPWYARAVTIATYNGAVCFLVMRVRVQGTCDVAKGQCKCAAPFTGAACERRTSLQPLLRCPGECVHAAWPTPGLLLTEWLLQCGARPMTLPRTAPGMACALPCGSTTCGTTKRTRIGLASTRCGMQTRPQHANATRVGWVMTARSASVSLVTIPCRTGYVCPCGSVCQSACCWHAVGTNYGSHMCGGYVYYPADT